MEVISIVFIVAGAVGLLFQIASSFRRESIRIDKFLDIKNALYEPCLF